jgi:hypothetical protein
MYHQVTGFVTMILALPLYIYKHAGGYNTSTFRMQEPQK